MVLKNSHKMNNTERAYETHLKILERLEEILWFKFEGMKLKLADKTYYTPDFCVINKLGCLEFHEVKGYWRDDARVKIKVASAMYPFKFIAVQKKGRDWITEEF